MIIAAREAAAPNSNPIAKDHYIKPEWLRSKNATELIIDIVATKKYKLTKMLIILICTNLSFIIQFIYILPVTNPPVPQPEEPPFLLILYSRIVATHKHCIPYTSAVPVGK